MFSGIRHNKCSFIGRVFFSVILLYPAVLFAYSNSVTLSWIPPVTDIKGSPLTDIGGYKLYYGNRSRNYTHVVNVGRDTLYEVNYLTEGLTYYFAVTAYDTSGNESEYSYEVSKMIVSSDGPAVANPGGIYSRPAVSFTGYPTSGTAPLTVQFSNATAEYDRSLIYLWDLDGNGMVDSNMRDPSVIYEDPGIYSIKLTAADPDRNKNTLTRTNYITVCYSVVNIAGASASYNSLQTAYRAAHNMDTVQSRNASLSGDLHINRNITVAMQGGYDCLHSAQPGSTTIMGNIRITSGKLIIQGGKLVVQ